MRGAWGRLFIEPFVRFKWWLLWKLEPWYEERASLDLAWRVFARKHNAAGKRPICAYDGWEKDLDPMDKLELYDEREVDPDYLEVALRKQYEDRTVNQNRS
jgi:hypothetical protein